MEQTSKTFLGVQTETLEHLIWIDSQTSQLRFEPSANDPNRVILTALPTGGVSATSAIWDLLQPNVREENWLAITVMVSCERQKERTC